MRQEKELPLQVNRQNPGALPAQIVEQVRALIEAGALRAGDALPSSRSLAAQLDVSRGTVVFAYEQLVGEGYMEASRGGTRVARSLRGLSAPRAAEAADATPDQGSTGQEHFPQPAAAGASLGPGPSPRRGSGTEAAYGATVGAAAAGTAAAFSATASRAPSTLNLLPGAPDTSVLATTEWRAAWRAAAARLAGPYPPAGSPELCVQLAEHLRLTRSLVRSPNDLLVTAGARDGFRLVLTALRQRVRHRPLRIAVENPGYPSLHRIPLAFNHQLLPIEVDKAGLNPALLPTGEHRPDLVLVAPSHQYPLGASMPAARRLELIDWARTHGAFIVEDDYDSELRYTGDPLPALAALDRPARPLAQGDDRVITLGSFAKVLSPGLTLGFLVVPRQLQAEMLSLRADLGNPVSALVQDAMTSFLATGGVRRHIARMRRVYRGRRALVTEALAGLPGTEVLPMDGGLHAVLRLSGGAAAEERAVQRAAAAGVLVAPLGAYWSAPVAAPASLLHRPEPLHGLVLGFGGVNDRKLVRGLSLLTSILGPETSKG